MSKLNKPRLGRGLSSLMSIPVSIEPPPEGFETMGESINPTIQTAESGAVQPAADHSPLPAPPSLSSSSIPQSEIRNPQSPDTPATPAMGLVWIAVESITANPYQPRRTFDPAALEQLAQSIRQDGVMQPIIVRPTPAAPGSLGNGTSETNFSAGPTYQLVAGERRWRAAQKAALPRIPAIVRQLDDEQLAEWAVIENVQREDLNPIERAEAFSRLTKQFRLTHERVAERVGVERVTITNLLRLIELHKNVQELVRLGKLSAGHGRALLAIPDAASQLALAQKAVAGGWSVRMIEATVRRTAQAAAPAERQNRARTAVLEDLERQIATQLHTKVHIKTGRKKNAGTLMIEFYDLQQFDALLEKLGVEVESQ